MGVPNFPVAPESYNKRQMDQFVRILTLYLQELANTEALEAAQSSMRATTDTAVTVLLTDGVVLVDTTAGNTTVTLPDPAVALYNTYGVKRTTGGTNTLTIQSAEGTIDGGTSSLVGQYDFLACKSDGTNYWIVSRITGWGY